MKNFNILACDPGKNNFAISILKITPLGIKILYLGMLVNTINDLTPTGELLNQHRKFHLELLTLVTKYKVKAIVAERFQNRGRMRGNSGELVNVMLGSILCLPVEKVLLITPAQWKNALNKQLILKDMYSYGLVEHKVDAVFIGCYGLSLYTNRKPYSKYLKSINRQIKLWKWKK
jgi:hypothetical protein